MLGRLFGLIQLGLGGRCYDVLCAISSDAIIDRSKAPKDVAAKLVKTEFIADGRGGLKHFEILFDFAAQYNPRA